MGHLEPHWDASALLVIDLQRDFLDGGALPIPWSPQVVPAVIRLAAAYRSAGLPVVHVVRFHVPGDSDVDLPRRAAIEAGAEVAAPGTPGSQLAPDLEAIGVRLVRTADVVRAVGAVQAAA